MTRLFRWKYVLPRLAVVLVVVATVRFGLDPLLRYALVATGEATIGSKVELESIDTRLPTGRATLTELAIANPKSPLRNLLQFREAELQLDLAALSHRSTVIKQGAVRGLRFDTDRSSSGALERESPTGDESSGTPAWARAAADTATDWLDESISTFTTDFTAQLETPRLVEELEAAWKAEHAALVAQVESLRTAARQIQGELKEAGKNPLRNAERLAELQQKFRGTSRELAQIQGQLRQVPERAKKDRLALDAARRHDQQLIRQQFDFEQLDAAAINEALLGRQAAEQLNTVVAWLRQIRSVTASRPTPVEPAAARGTQVRYALDARPRFHIEQLQLEGEAQLGGKPLEFAGTLTDFSTDPRLISQPTRLEIKSDGVAAVRISAELNRRGNVPRDIIIVACPALPIPQRNLGNPRRLALRSAAATATVEARIEIIGDALEGTVTFVQIETEWDAATEREQLAAVATACGRALSSLGQLEATVTISGTLDRPRFQIASDFGNKLAAGLNTAIKLAVEEQSQALLASVGPGVDARLQSIVDARTAASDALLTTLGSTTQAGAGGMSVPQIGGLPGFGSLRR